MRNPKIRKDSKGKRFIYAYRQSPNIEKDIKYNLRWDGLPVWLNKGKAISMGNNIGDPFVIIRYKLPAPKSLDWENEGYDFDDGESGTADLCYFGFGGKPLDSKVIERHPEGSPSDFAKFFMSPRDYDDRL